MAMKFSPSSVHFSFSTNSMNSSGARESGSRKKVGDRTYSGGRMAVEVG